MVTYQGSRVPGKGTIVTRISKREETLRHWMGGDQKPLSFDWSYPSQSTIALAMALLADALGGHDMAGEGIVARLAPKFSEDVVEKFAFDEWEYAQAKTVSWMERNGKY